MKKVIALLYVVLLALNASSSAATNSHVNSYGNCPGCNYSPCRCPVGNSLPGPQCTAPSCRPPPCPAPCDPCAPCAPAWGTECGVSICAIGVAVLAVVAAAAIILSAEEPQSVH